MVILFLTGCFSESINKRISRSLGIEIPKDIKIEYEDTHGGFHGDGETVAVVEFNNSIGEDIQSEMLNNEDWNKLPLRGSSVFSEKSHQIYVFINKIGTHRKLFNESLLLMAVSHLQYWFLFLQKYIFLGNLYAVSQVG